MREDLRPSQFSWHAYPGEYEKEFCAVRLRNGTEMPWCWPNAGKFLDLRGGCGIFAQERDVVEIRYLTEGEAEACMSLVREVSA